MIRTIQLVLSRKIFPALRIFVYKHGYRPKYGSPLFSPTLNVLFRYKDAAKGITRRK